MITQRLAATVNYIPLGEPYIAIFTEYTWQYKSVTRRCKIWQNTVAKAYRKEGEPCVLA